jgi:hypothetical protein
MTITWQAIKSAGNGFELAALQEPRIAELKAAVERDEAELAELMR